MLPSNAHDADHEATAALLMLNKDRRNGANDKYKWKEHERQGFAESSMIHVLCGAGGVWDQ